jgi:hypothetical protein
MVLKFVIYVKDRSRSRPFLMQFGLNKNEMVNRIPFSPVHLYSRDVRGDGNCFSNSSWRGRGRFSAAINIFVVQAE